MRLEGKVIVIVGGTTGMGLSASQAFVKEGARIVVVGRNSQNAATAIRSLGSNARSYVGDAAESATAPKAIELALSKFGKFDGVYHVAGGSGRKH